jgi:hypothetical protein
MRVSGILGDCLSTETLQRLYPAYSSWKGGRSFLNSEVKQKLFEELITHAGRVVTEELERELTPDEVMLVYNRVKQFLIARGFD